MGIRGKLLILIMTISILAPASVGYLAFQTSDETINRSVRASFALRADIVQTRISQELDTIRNNASAWAKQVVMTETYTFDDDLNLSAFLVGNKRAYPIIDNLTVVDLNLELIASTIPEIDDWTDAEIRAKLTRYGLTDYETLGSDLEAYARVSKAESFMVFPAWDVLAVDGAKMIGILVVDINLAILTQAIQEVNRRSDPQDSVNIILSDGRQEITSDLAASQIYDFAALENLLSAATLSGGFATLDTGQEKLAFASEALETGAELSHPLYVSILKPESEILAPIYQLANRITVVGLIIVVLASILGIAFAESISKPLGILTRTTQKIMNSGDLSLRVSLRTRDHTVATLSDSFNALIRQIETKNAELEETNRTLERRVQDRTAQLTHAKAGIAEMLDNMSQGILTFDSDLKINEFTSKHAAHLLGMESLTGLDVMTTIFSNTSAPEQALSILRTKLNLLFGATSFQWQITIRSLLKEVQRERAGQLRDLRISYEPIYDSNSRICRIMVILEDITELKTLQHEAQQKQEKLQKLSDIVSIDAQVLQSFLLEADQILHNAQQRLQTLHNLRGDDYREQLDALFRGIHTLKGSAGLFKLVAMQRVTHEMEDYLSNLQSGEETFHQGAADKISKHLDFIYQELADYKQMRFELLGLTADHNTQLPIRGLTHAISHLRQLIKDAKVQDSQQEAIQGIFDDISSWMFALSAQSFLSYIDSYEELIQDIATKLGKNVGPLELSIQWPYVTEEVGRKLNGALIHLLRNALDHGIEAPAARSAARKPEMARIALAMVRVGKTLEISLSDDGVGIDGEALAQKAEEQGMITPDERNAMTQQQKVDLLYRAGLSTKDAVTEISGRGFGVDAVHQSIIDLGGEIRITSEKGKGTTFFLKLPWQQAPKRRSKLKSVA